jgi:predicted RNA methylase
MDPFGGSGVTAIEAFLHNRTGIQNDINPLANLIAKGIVNLKDLNIKDFYESLTQIEEECHHKIQNIYQSNDRELEKFRRDLNLPPNIELPKNSDAQLYYDLFSPKQLISLALIKDAIDTVRNPQVRNALLLAWSATLPKINKTFLSAKGRAESRGGSSIFSIYRYKIAKKPVELQPWKIFHDRTINIAEAAREITQIIELKTKTKGWSGKFLSYTMDVEELDVKFEDCIDYIFTDPPYGGNISYLDLSILWNSWLGMLPSEKERKKELIVGGELKLSEDHYIKRLANSVRSCFNMLRDNRWLSIVFQHWNISYFEAILSAADESGAELKAAISQIGDPIWSMHKKKGKESVLAGEAILTFFKGKKTAKSKKTDNNATIDELFNQVLSRLNGNEIYGEYLFNLLVIESWKYQRINRLDISKEKLSELLKDRGWAYNDDKHCWTKGETKKELLLTHF